MIDAMPGVMSFAPTKRPNQVLRERAEHRRIVREEMRYDELKNKAKSGGLTNEEKAELALMQFNKALEKVAENPPVMYVA